MTLTSTRVFRDTMWSIMIGFMYAIISSVQHRLDSLAEKSMVYYYFVSRGVGFNAGSSRIFYKKTISYHVNTSINAKHLSFYSYAVRAK